MSDAPVEATPTNQEAKVTSPDEVQPVANIDAVTPPSEPEVAGDAAAAKPEAEAASDDASKSSPAAGTDVGGVAGAVGDGTEGETKKEETSAVAPPESPKPEVEEGAAAPPAGEVLETPRVVIVTGASSGIGYHVARVLCARKHDVILACRNEPKAQKAIDKIRKETPDAQATYMQLDLADLDSVRTFVNNFHATGKQLSVLVNNAGMILNAKDAKLQFTKENFELTMATNHLGHFLLTNLLLNDLKKAASELGDARIVVVTCSLHDPAVAHKKGGGAIQPFDIEDLFLYKDGSYSGMQAYKNSKLANIMFTYELVRQLGDSGVKVNAIDPGFVPTTELLRYSSSVQKFYARYILHGLLRFTKHTRSGTQAGTDISSLAVTDKFKDVTGKYIQNSQETKSSDESLNESLQKKLWELSAGYVLLEGFEPLTATRPVVKTPPTPAVDAPVNGVKDAVAAESVDAKDSGTDVKNEVKNSDEGETEKERKEPETTPTKEEPVSTKPEENGSETTPQKAASDIVNEVIDTAIKVVNGDSKEVESSEPASKAECEQDLPNGGTEEKTKPAEPELTAVQ